MDGYRLRGRLTLTCEVSCDTSAIILLEIFIKMIITGINVN